MTCLWRGAQFDTVRLDGTDENKYDRENEIALSEMTRWHTNIRDEMEAIIT